MWVTHHTADKTQKNVVQMWCANPLTNHGTRNSAPRTPLTCDFLERMTGFEPATLTLAR